MIKKLNNILILFILIVIITYCLDTIAISKDSQSFSGTYEGLSNGDFKKGLKDWCILGKAFQISDGVLTIDISRQNDPESRIWQDIEVCDGLADFTLKGSINAKSEKNGVLRLNLYGYDSTGDLKMVMTYVLVGKVDPSWTNPEKTIPYLNGLYSFDGEIHWLRRRYPFNLNKQDESGVCWVTKKLNIPEGNWQEFFVESVKADFDKQFPDKWDGLRLTKVRYELEVFNYSNPAGNVIAYVKNLSLTTRNAMESKIYSKEDKNLPGKLRNFAIADSISSDNKTIILRRNDTVSFKNSAGVLTEYKLLKGDTSNKSVNIKPITIGDLSIENYEKLWMLKSSKMSVNISASTGMATEMKVPEFEQNLMGAGPFGFVLYILNESEKWFAPIDKLISAESISGKLDDKNYVGVKCELEPSDPDIKKLLNGDIEYRIFDDRIDIVANIKPITTKSGIFEIGLAGGIQGDLWDTHIFLTTQHLEISARQEQAKIYKVRYGDRLWDNTKSHIGSAYPHGVLNGKSGLLLWGCRDMGTFVILTPNNLGSPVSLTYRPADFTSGRTYKFDLTLSFFPKPKNGYTEVLSWYLKNNYSSDPLSKGIVSLTDDRPKTIGIGNLTNGSPLTPTSQKGLIGRPLSQDWGNLVQDLEQAKKLKLVNVWYGGWDSMVDDMKPSGKFNSMYLGPTSADDLKQDIKEIQQKGFRVYMYFRQFINPFYAYDDKPPYKSWINRKKDGTYLGQGYKTIVPPGEPLVCYDFGNPDCVKWYTERVKAILDYYEPDGIAWDMSWIDLLNDGGFSYSHPESGYHHGILRLFHDVYQYIKEKHPNMRVITNNTQGSPTSLYSDGTLFEGGIEPGHWIIGSQATKALRIPKFSLNYRETVEQAKIEFAIGTVPHMVLCPDMEYVAQRTAKIPALAEVIESTAVEITPSDKEIFCSSWAKNDDFLSAIYNREKNSIDIIVKYDKMIFAKYNQSLTTKIIVTCIGEKGKPIIGEAILITRDSKENLIISGQIKPEELWIVELEREN